MGKADFPGLYQNAKRTLNSSSLSIKVSFFSDRYDAYHNYSGIIVYHHDASFEWRAFPRPCAPNGYRGKAFYVFIKRTDGGPDSHAAVYKQMFQHCDIKQGRTCCGGFSISEGTVLPVASLNDLENMDDKAVGAGLDPDFTWESDGSLGLSEPEELLVQVAVEGWKSNGPNSMLYIPDTVDQRIEDIARYYADKPSRVEDDKYAQAYQYAGEYGVPDKYGHPQKASGSEGWSGDADPRSGNNMHGGWYPDVKGGPELPQKHPASESFRRHTFASAPPTGKSFGKRNFWSKS